MANNCDDKADKSLSALPECSNEKGQLSSAVAFPERVDQLQQLQAWLALREQESNRQVRPAWMEVVQALINLTQQRLEAGEFGVERLSFETHLVARQAARQRGARQLPTRFVTDEIRRIGNHQSEYLDSLKASGRPLAMVGWFRWQNRRRLGLALIDYDATLTGEAGSEECAASPKNQAEVDGVEFAETTGLSPVLSPQPVFANKYLWFAGAAGFALSFVLCTLWYVILRDPDSDATAKSRAESTLPLVETIQARGKLLCGIDGLLPHFSLYSGREQMWWGLDVELCRALAAAMDVEVEFIKVSASRFPDRVQALLDKKVDILFRNTTHTIARDLNHNTVFGPVYFYEKESFLDFNSHGSSELLHADELEGKKICVKPGTSNQRTLQQLQARSDFTLVTASAGIELSDNKKLMDAIRNNPALCDFAFGNYYVLLLLKNDQQKRNKSKNVSIRYLSDFGLDALAPLLLQDERWRRVVSHVIYALMYADELQVNSFNLDRIVSSADDIKKRFLQGAGTEKLALGDNWVQRVIAAVGSYNEIYFRSFSCEDAACELGGEAGLEAYLAAEELWPNKLFKHSDVKSGMLVIPRF